MMASVMAQSTRVVGVAVGMLAGVLVAAAPASADPPPTPKVDQKQAVFMKYLTDHGLPYTSETKAVALAHTTCDILGTDSSTRVQDAATAIQNDIDMRPEQMQSFAAAALGVYCPSVKVP
jgi:hypothetical protein